MESKLTQLKAFKKTTLTEEERSLLRAHAARIIMTSPVLVTESFFKRGVQHGLRIALSSTLFVVFIAFSISTVAANSLPGDPLYPFKINVNEEVKGLFLKTPEEKVAYQQNRVETRADEIQTLAESNSLTQAKQEIAAAALSSNVQDLSTNLTALSAQAPSAALTVTASLKQTLQANKAAIENTPSTDSTDDSGKAAAIQSVNAALQTVSNQEVQIISQEIDTINTAVTTVPTTVGVPVSATATAAVSAQTPATSTPAVTPIAP